MRCPACNTNNRPTEVNCTACQAPMPGPARRAKRKNEANEPDSPRTIEYNEQVKKIFHLCLISLIPFVGLILGPLGAKRAWDLLQQGKADPAFQAERAAQTAVLLGLLTASTNWLGLSLIVVGLVWPS